MPTVEHEQCQLHYTMQGQGPRVLFVQGIGLHGDGWGPQTSVLNEHYTCLSFDNRGMASSQPVGSRTLDIDLMVQDALAIADHVNWDSFHLVGHSMGGHIASALTLKAPQRVQSLTLMCTSVRGKDMPPMSASMLWTSLRSRVGTRHSRRQAFLEMVLPKQIRAEEDLEDWAERLAPIFGHDLADTPPIVMSQVWAIRQHDVTKQLAQIEGIPTLVISADEDPLSPPRFGAELADAIANATHTVIKGHAHGVTVSAADTINDLLRTHFSAEEAQG